MVSSDVSEKRYGLSLSAGASKFLAVWLGFLWAILLIIIFGCCSVGRAWRIGRHKAFYICVRMFGESGASANNCDRSAALTQWHKQKAIVVKRERRCRA